MGKTSGGPPASKYSDAHLERSVGYKSAVAIAVAAMTGSCLVLPGGASYYSGTSAFLAILVSGVLATPHCLCVSELASAMPINGGEFVYLSQAYGPMIGTMCGVGLYCSLLLKGSFGLVGAIYYLEAVTGKLDGWLKALLKLGCLLAITVLNLQGMKKLKTVQKQFTMIATLLLFILAMIAFKEFDNSSMESENLFTNGFRGILESAAFVYMSFAGITKICSVGGEVKKPGATLPKAIITAAFGMTVFFSLTTLAIVGCIDLKTLKNDFAPFYTMSDKAGGDILGWATAILCIITMIGMANVAIAAVSRFPYAMARDGLLPDILMETWDNGAPIYCILLSAFLMGIAILTIDVKGIAKLASSFNLIVFISGDLSLMIYRTHSHGKYRPEYTAPFYPFLPLAGVVGQLVLLVVLGAEGILALLVFAFIGLVLYLWFGRHNARFLGVLLPESYLGILPDHFKSKVELEKEMMRIRKDPLYHYHKSYEGHETRHKADEVSSTHVRQYKFAEQKSRTNAIGMKQKSTLNDHGHDMYIFRIAFTGGYHGGKHTLIHLLAKDIVKEGYDVYICPKISRFFMNHGVKRDSNHGDEQQVLFEAEVMQTQLRHERAFQRLGALTNRPCVVLYNRGLMDIKAYCEDVWQDVLDTCELDEQYLLDRYDMVLHCETSCANPDFNGDVDVQEQLRIDDAWIDSWKTHAERQILHWQPEFEDKFNEAKEHVLHLLTQQTSGVFSEADLKKILSGGDEFDEAALDAQDSFSFLAGRDSKAGHAGIEQVEFDVQETFPDDTETSVTSTSDASKEAEIPV